MPKKHARSQGARAPALPEGVADADSVTTSLLASDSSAPLIKSTSAANVRAVGSLQAGATDSTGAAVNALDGLPLSAAGMLAVYTVINLLSYFDRGALSGTLEDISADFTNVSSTQRGLLGSAFMVGYMIASPIFAHLVTKFEPFRVMATGLFIWCCATTLCALSPSYWLVLAGRVFTGFGEASFLCIAPPFIDKFAPKGRKSVWLSVFYTAIPVGYALGFLASGIWLGAQPLGKTWSWRAIFAFEAAAMLPFVFFSLIGKSPFSFSPDAVQPAGEGAASPAALLDAELTGAASPQTASAAAEADRFALGVRAIIGNKLFLCVVLGYAMQTFVTGGMAFFGLDYAKEELDMSKSMSGIGFGGITVLTGILGTMAGGVILDRLRERRGIPSAAKKASPRTGAEDDGDDLALLDAHLVTAPAEAGAPDASAAGYKAGHRAMTAATAAGVDDDAMDAASVRARERAQNDLQNPVNVRDRIESSLIAVKLVTLMTLIATPFAAAAFLLPGKPAFFLFLFITEFFLFCCFSPLNNCIMWTVPFSLAPQALAFSVIFTHALGDALSPVVMGFLLDQTHRKWRLVMLISCTILFLAIFFWGVAFYFARDLFVAVKHFPYSRTGVSTSSLAAKRKNNGQTTDASGAARPAAGESAIASARPTTGGSAGYLDAVATAMMRADGTHVTTAPDAAEDDDDEHESLIGPFVYVRDKLKWSLIDRDDPNF